MDSLPLEIHYAIIDQAPVPSLRAVNKYFSGIATPAIFRVLLVSSKQKHAERILNIQRSQHLRGYVKELDLQYVAQEDRLKPISPGERPPIFSLSCLTRLSIIDVNIVFALVFRNLHMLPALESIRLNFGFDAFYRGGTAWIYDQQIILQEFQSAILNALTRCCTPSTFKSLALFNLMAALDGAPIPLPVMAAFMRKTSLFSMSVVGDRFLGDLLSRDALSHFWGITAPVQILQHARCLTTLALNIDPDYGFIPCLDVQPLHFPLLTSLSLCHFLFGHSGQGPHDLDDFVVRHKMTLRSLTLDSCPMLFDEWGPELLWSEIWQRFQTELENLDYLAVSWAPGEGGQSDGTRYYVLDPLVGYVARDFYWSFMSTAVKCRHSYRIQAEMEDTSALDRFQEMLWSRKIAES